MTLAAGDLDIDLSALSSASGLVLEHYREAHIATRVQRALRLEHVRTPQELARRMSADPDARARFRRSVAISVSGMFRDPEQFQLLEERVLPALVAGGRRITVWSAGCADGSELYSIGLMLDRLGALDRALLLGSDLLPENLERARRAEYPGVEIPRRVQARTRWEQRDLASGARPLGRFALVVCRNVAIYMTEPARATLRETLVPSLADGGHLLLGRSERLVDQARLGLAPAGPHLYRRTPCAPV
jgi:chemotaxis protein methyltransferase CheR